MRATGFPFSEICFTAVEPLREGHTMKRILLLITALSLAGCYEHQPGGGELGMSAEQIAAKDDAICKGYGAQPGTSAYINCRGQQDRRRDDFLYR